jgi:hypothetical protein
VALRDKKNKKGKREYIVYIQSLLIHHDHVSGKEKVGQRRERGATVLHLTVKLNKETCVYSGTSLYLFPFFYLLAKI